jgi:hypothetical protein
MLRDGDVLGYVVTGTLAWNTRVVCCGAFLFRDKKLLEGAAASEAAGATGQGFVMGREEESKCW